MKRFACLCLLLLFASGCQSLMHELQPHRLRRLNYFSRSGRPDAGMYSVQDDLSQPVAVHASPVSQKNTTAVTN